MRTTLLVLTLIVHLSVPARASAQSIPGVGTGMGVVGNEMNPAISLILDFAGSYFSQADHVRLGGHAPASSGITLTGGEFAATANVDPYFRFDMALCFAHMHLEEIYLTTLSLPWNLQFRGGLFLARLGRHNPTHPHSWRFVLHPLPNQFIFGAEGLGAPGAELSWLIPVPWFAELTAAVQHGEGGAFRSTPLSAGEPTFSDMLYPVRLENFFDLSDDWAFQLGANALFGPAVIGPEAGNRSFAYGVDSLLKWRPIGWGETGFFHVTWINEFWFREMEVPGEVWRDFGGYTDLIWGISKRWETALRGEIWKRLEGSTPTAENGRGKLGAETLRTSAALTFIPSHFSKIRVQYTLEDVEGYDLNHIGLVQFEVSAGAHGAHEY